MAGRESSPASSSDFSSSWQCLSLSDLPPPVALCLSMLTTALSHQAGALLFERSQALFYFLMLAQLQTLLEDRPGSAQLHRVGHGQVEQADELLGRRERRRRHDIADARPALAAHGLE